MTPPLSPEQARSVAAVRAMYEAERRRDLEGWCALWHPTGRQTFAWGDGLQAVEGLGALRRSTAAKFAARTDVVIVDRVSAMADPRRVFAIAELSMRIAGCSEPLATTVWCRFDLDGAGLIVEQREAVDTARLATFARTAA